MGGLDWIGWVSPGGGMYRAPYGANKEDDDDDDERVGGKSLDKEEIDNNRRGVSYALHLRSHRSHCVTRK